MFPWSSAPAHCQRTTDDVLTSDASWRKRVKSIGDWSAWLAEGDDPEKLLRLRRHVEKGLPCGSEAFIRTLEKHAKRVLRYRPQGRPKKSDKE